MLPLFTNVALLAGLAGIAGPILIHLLLRRKSQRVRFSTIQFFVKRDEQSMRKRKLRNLLLLSARVILFALIVLAFARPYLPIGGRTPNQAPRQQVVLLLDTSASMLATGTGGQQWEKAKQLAQKVLGGLQADDQVALVSSAAQNLTLSEFAPASVVSEKLAKLQATAGSGDLSEGLRYALKVLSRGNVAFPTTLYIVSDLQRNGCQNIGNVPLPNSVSLKILDLGERFSPNVSVTEVQLERQNQIEPRAVISSFSDENLSGARLTFKVDSQEVSAGAIDLAEGATTNVPLVLPALTPGWHSAEVKINVRDSLAADDSHYSTVFVPEPVHGLVVEPKKSVKVFQEESYFIGAALDPAHGTNQSGRSRYTYEKLSLEGFSQKLQGSAGNSKPEFVILPAVKQPSTSDGSALASYVRGGGGLLIFLGDEVSANAYNSTFHELLPAELGKKNSTDESEAPWRIAEFKKSSPLFSVFAEPNSGNLLLPEFRTRFTLTPVRGSVVVAEFDDGTPLVISQQIGKGNVVLVNTSGDTKWTDWQKHKTFVPWMQATATFLANRKTVLDHTSSESFASGNEVDFELGLAKQSITLKREGGTELKLKTDDQGRLRDVVLDAPGIYSLKDDTGKELRRIAVNLPPSESSLSSLAPGDLQQQIVRSAEPLRPTLSASLFGNPSQGREYWRILLLGALVLMLMEPLMANKTAA
jgi:hypothetical protein